MNDETSAAAPPAGWTAGAWTVDDVAARLHVSVMVAEMLAETAVVRGQLTRVSCGLWTGYLNGSVRSVQGAEAER